MRSAVIAAAFAAGAFAVPHQKRIVTKVDLTYVTELVTITYGVPVPTSLSSSIASSTTLAAALHFGNHEHIQPKPKPASQVSPSVVVEAVVVAETAAPSPVAHSEVVVQQAKPQQQSQPESSSGSIVVGASSGGDTSNFTPSSSGSSYQNMVINSHNIHRANHSSPAIQWDDNLANSAEILAQTCVFGHVMDINGGGYGQNIASGPSPDNVDVVITNMWYNGELPHFTYYGLATPPNLIKGIELYGHMTQVVWKGSNKVGCATVDCGGRVPGGFYTVCNYAGKGNFEGYFNDNVFEPLGHPTVVAGQ